MITQISGRLIEKTPTYVVIECNGIGYKIHVSLQTYSLVDGESCKLFTHLSIKEDSHTLYGFYNQDERHLFRNLISVSGVGPSTAQVILSTYNTDEIVLYITSADVGAIQHVKGIGAKTAQRVLLDLKDKIVKVYGLDDVSVVSSNTNKNEALSALDTLGFTRKQAEKVCDAVIKQYPQATIEEIIKQALKKL